jgi:hypothetical protein
MECRNWKLSVTIARWSEVPHGSAHGRRSKLINTLITTTPPPAQHHWRPLLHYTCTGLQPRQHPNPPPPSHPKAQKQGNVGGRSGWLNPHPPASSSASSLCLCLCLLVGLLLFSCHSSSKPSALVGNHSRLLPPPAPSVPPSLLLLAPLTRQPALKFVASSSIAATGGGATPATTTKPWELFSGTQFLDEVAPQLCDAGEALTIGARCWRLCFLRYDQPFS